MSTSSRSADGQRNSLHPTGSPGTMRRPVPQRRTTDRECRCRPRRCQWLGISTRLTNISRHSIHHLCNHTCETSLRRWRRVSNRKLPARRAYPRNSVAVNCNAAADKRPVVRREVHGATATCTSAVPSTHKSAGLFIPNPASSDDGEGNRAVSHSRLRGLEIIHSCIKAPMAQAK